MTSVNDHHDATRAQYVSHKLYLERRAGNRYYNLGYAYYKEMLDATSVPIGMLITHFRPAWINFEIALLFNKNDVDAAARKVDLCTLWTTKADIPTLPDQATRNTWSAQANTTYRQCKC